MSDLNVTEVKEETIEVPVTIELSHPMIPGQRWASIKFAGVTVYSGLVYDNEESPASKNILLMFGHRLRALLEDE